MTEAISHAIGVLEARMDHNDKTHEEIRKAVVKQGEALAKIQKTLDQLTGGYKVVFWMMGAAAAIGAGLSWFANHIAIK